MLVVENDKNSPEINSIRLVPKSTKKSLPKLRMLKSLPKHYLQKQGEIAAKHIKG